MAGKVISLLNTVSKWGTVTFDNGGEFTGHVRVFQAAGVDIFFAKPIAS